METNENPDETIICTSPISHSGKSPFLPELQYLQSITSSENEHGEIKLTMPAPEWYHLRYKEGQAYDSSVYKNDEEYFDDIAKAYRVEIDILYKAGLRNLQLDDPNLACRYLLWVSLLLCIHVILYVLICFRSGIRLLLRENAARMERRHIQHSNIR
jgi:hypothetical protein